MRALIAPDSFKGSLTSAEVATALAGGFADAGWDADQCPLADGGEGTAAMIAAALGGDRVEVEAADPLGRQVSAAWWALADGRTAIVEVAEASGLGRVAAGERDAVAAGTRGTGELIAAAARRAQTVLVALGGSATTDGGIGALEAIRAAGGLGDARLVCLCDVTTPWERAAEVFAPQKGATPQMVAELAGRLGRLASQLPRDPRGVPMSGAAGGLAGGLWAELGAGLERGAKFVCDMVGLDQRIAAADLVVGGEGALDASTLEGKVLAEVARRCAAASKPLHAVVGRDDSDERVRQSLELVSVKEAGTAGDIAAAAVEIAQRRRSRSS